MITLSPRLQTAADMVRSGVVAADIGTDHAYLPSYLVLSGRCPHTLACDLRRGPLENARETLERYSITELVELRLSDGLDELCENEADDIIMTGMGGTLIAQLLSRTEWIRNAGKRLILQPMSHAEDVRLFLMKNGFDTVEERTCRDEGRVYVVICAEYSGRSGVFPDGYEFYGRLDPADELAQYLVLKQYKRVKTRATSLRKAGIKPDEAAYCERACAGMEFFLKQT